MKARRMMRLRLALAISPLVIAAIGALFITNHFWRGLLFGIALGPLVLFGFSVLLHRAFRRKLDTGTLEPPPLPSASWDYRMDLSDLDGNPVDLDQWRGKVVLLNFWATWCAPCVAEMPGLGRLQEKVSGPAVQFAFVSREDAATVAAFAAKRGFNFPMFVLRGETPAAFSGRAIPATFIIDRGGTIVLRHMGAAAWDTEPVANFVRGLIATPS